MLTMKTPIVTPSETSAPSRAVHGRNSSVPPSTSANPMKRSYPGEAPIEYQITPIGEKLPYGSSSRLKKIVGIWSGYTLAKP